MVTDAIQAMRDSDIRLPALRGACSCTTGIDLLEGRKPTVPAAGAGVPGGIELELVEGGEEQLMMRISLAICVALAVAPPATGQEASDIPNRDGRIVVSSPHFDQPPFVEGPLNCMGRAVRLVGFEGTESRDSLASLSVRVFLHPDATLNREARREGLAEPRQPLSHALVRLVERLGTPSADSLPAGDPWRVGTDSTGFAEFVVPSGIYRAQFERLGFRTGEGVIRIRPAIGDSLHVFLDTQAICD